MDSPFQGPLPIYKPLPGGSMMRKGNVPVVDSLEKGEPTPKWGAKWGATPHSKIPKNIFLRPLPRGGMVPPSRGVRNPSQVGVERDSTLSSPQQPYHKEPKNPSQGVP